MKTDVDILLIRALEWIEHEYELIESFSPTCKNDNNDCLKCAIRNHLNKTMETTQ